MSAAAPVHGALWYSDGRSPVRFTPSRTFTEADASAARLSSPSPALIGIDACDCSACSLAWRKALERGLVPGLATP